MAIPANSVSMADRPALARVLEAALRETDFSARWQAMQENPDDVDPATGAVDPAATVSGSLEAQRSD